MDSKLYQKTFFTLLFLALIAISFLIIKPFLTAVLTGIVFSYIFYPFYSRINKKIANKNFSSLITAVIVILIITLPLFFVLNTISREAYTTYLLSKQIATSGQFFECQPADKAICAIPNYIADKADDPKIRYYFDETVKGATTKITSSISNILFSIPRFMLDLFVMLFVMFFLFRDGKIFVDKIERMLPLEEKHREHVFRKLNDMTYAVIYGSIIVAVIQGALGGVGFLIFGLPSPLLWGLVMVFAALIPFVGTSIIWFPAALMLIFNGYLNSESSLIIKGVLLMLYGILIVGTIDNILKPKIIGSKGGLHPVLVLLGVVGGLKFLGVIGLVIGPILLAMLVTFIEIYEEEKSDKNEA